MGRKWKAISDFCTFVQIVQWGWWVAGLLGVATQIETAILGASPLATIAYGLTAAFLSLLAVIAYELWRHSRLPTPAVMLLAPTQTYHLRWAPLIEFHPYMAPEPQALESAVNQPITFGLKNLGTTPIQDIRLEWAFECGGNTLEMILRSPHTRRFNPTVNDDLISLSRGIYRLALRLLDHETQTMPYLIATATNNHVEQLAMPEYFARAFKMRVVAMQDRILKSPVPLVPDKRESGPTISVILSWGPSQARTTWRYRVYSEIRVLPNDVGAPGLLNISPQQQAPENLRAYITFTVGGID